MMRAHSAVQRAVKAGELVRPSECKCGSTRHIQGHHKDYNKPLDVEWLCAKCHRAETPNGPDGVKGVRGTDHKNAKLTDAEIVEIRNSAAEGKDLAIAYGVHPATISRIRNFKQWRHVKC